VASLLQVQRCLARRDVLAFFDHPACLAYSIFVMLWAPALLVSWRRKCAVYGYKWGVLDYEVEEQTRPRFYGTR